MYRYDAAEDCYICPNNCRLHYQTTERGGNRLYVSEPSDCRECPPLSTRTASANQRKVFTRHVWERYRERARNNRLSEYGKAIYARRKETVERGFADAKQLHGHRYARMRGVRNVQEQSLLCAWAANIKKIALALSKGGAFYAYLSFIFHILRDTVVFLRLGRPRTLQPI